MCDGLCVPNVFRRKAGNYGCYVGYLSGGLRRSRFYMRFQTVKLNLTEKETYDDVTKHPAGLYAKRNKSQ